MLSYSWLSCEYGSACQKDSRQAIFLTIPDGPYDDDSALVASAFALKPLLCKGLLAWQRFRGGFFEYAHRNDMMDIENEKTLNPL